MILFTQNYLISVNVSDLLRLHPQNWLATLTAAAAWRCEFYQLESCKQYRARTESSEWTKYCLKHKKNSSLQATVTNLLSKQPWNRSKLGPERQFRMNFSDGVFSGKTLCLNDKYELNQEGKYKNNNNNNNNNNKKTSAADAYSISFCQYNLLRSQWPITHTFSSVRFSSYAY